METNETNETSKNGISKKIKLKSTSENIRVRRETKKRILAELMSLNKKEFGKPVTPDQFISLAISLMKPEHFESLKANSLSNKDRFEKRYLKHCEKNGKITRDEYLGILMAELNP